jgi:hypothetical protein
VSSFGIISSSGGTRRQKSSRYTGRSYFPLTWFLVDRASLCRRLRRFLARIFARNLTALTLTVTGLDLICTYLHAKTEIKQGFPGIDHFRLWSSHGVRTSIVDCVVVFSLSGVGVLVAPFLLNCCLFFCSLLLRLFLLLGVLF